MSSSSKIDMAEVTRLTQAGRLAEAVALLQAKSGTPHVGAGLSSLAPAGAATASSQPGSTAAKPFGIGDARGLRDLLQRSPSPGDSFLKSTLIPGVGGGPVSGDQTPVAVPDGARFEERSFSNPAGTLTYKVYVPTGYTGQALPVVLMLHGCTQDPDDFAAGTRMNALAEEHNFLVAYPRQPQSANMQKCWNWFQTGDQQRGAGEPSLLAGIALQVVAEFSADPSRVYVAGLSAGGAAAAIMAKTYPDIFAAVGIHSGVACCTATDMPSAFAAMGGHGAAPPKGSGPTLPTIVFHGDADRTVSPVNSAHIVAQASPSSAATNVATRGETPGGVAYTRTVIRDDAGQVLVEQWILHGVGHAWSGGSAAGSYTDARGPDASREFVRFFLPHTRKTAPQQIAGCAA